MHHVGPVAYEYMHMLAIDQYALYLPYEADLVPHKCRFGTWPWLSIWPALLT